LVSEMAKKQICKLYIDIFKNNGLLLKGIKRFFNFKLIILKIFY